MSDVTISLSHADRLARIMSRIFQTDPSPAESNELLAGLVGVAGRYRGVGFKVDPLTMQVSVGAHAGIDREATRKLLSGEPGLDPWLRAAMRSNTVGELVVVDDLRSAALASEKAGVEDYLRTVDLLGVAGCAGGVVRLEDGAPVCMAVYSSDEEPFTELSLELLRLVLRQLTYTATLRASRLAADIERRLLAATMDLCRMPVFILDARGVIVRLNTAGRRLLRRGDVFQAKSGRLTAAGSAEQVRLAAQIARVMSCSSLDMTATWHSNQGDRGGVFAVICPVRLEDVNGSAGPAYAVVSVADRLGASDALPPRLLGELFGLTDAEDRVARMIAGGATAAAVVEQTGLSLATVRTHLSHIFEKTETASQTELVRLLSALGPFRCGDEVEPALTPPASARARAADGGASARRAVGDGFNHRLGTS